MTGEDNDDEKPILSPRDAWERGPDDGMKKLMPELPEGYFDGMDPDDVFTNTDKNPVERYMDAKVKPYVKFRNMNNGCTATEEASPVNAAEIGVKVSF